MNICPLTYQPTAGKYSPEGLKKIAKNLTGLNPLNYSAEEQRHEAAKRAVKMSIQGVQPKISAVLDVSAGEFKIVDIKGRYIIKPQHHIYPQLPENEDLTMKMAEACGIEVPLHGLVYSKDGSLSYFIQRFDRSGHSGKLAMEDFAQLAGLSRDTKYDYSIEKLIQLIDTYCTFPAIEKASFYKRFLFNFLTGNEDMHLKNYSLLHRDGKVMLSPGYDLLNTTLVLSGDIEESALSIMGKKTNLSRKVLIDYLAKDRLQIATKVLDKILYELLDAQDNWQDLIERSFLEATSKLAYHELLTERFTRMEL
jgi:serine/threonine-protein kinase HipA